MIYFKLRYKVLGGRTHVRLFSSTDPHGTFGKNGDLIFRNEEWQDCSIAVKRAYHERVVIVPEEDDPTPSTVQRSE